MNCKAMETQLIAYLDGKAQEAERRVVELHLVACADCRARVEEFRALWGALDRVPALEPSPAFDARLRARIAAEPPPGLWRWLPQPRLAFALSLLLALSVWISSLPVGTNGNGELAKRNEEEFKMIRDLQLLEDYDVLTGFEPLSALKPAQKPEDREL